MNRRDVCRLFPAALLPAVAGIRATAAQDTSMPSMAMTFDQIPLHRSNGAQIRQILKGKVATGEELEAHETTLPPGGMPHPPHHHEHTEMWLVREGTVELNVNGTSHVLGPGGAGMVHSNEEHGIKNIGMTPATYFVIAVGPGAAKPTV